MNIYYYYHVNFVIITFKYINVNQQYLRNMESISWILWHLNQFFLLLLLSLNNNDINIYYALIIKKLFYFTIVLKLYYKINLTLFEILSLIYNILKKYEKIFIDYRFREKDVEIYITFVRIW